MMIDFDTRAENVIIVSPYGIAIVRTAINARISASPIRRWRVLLEGGAE